MASVIVVDDEAIVREVFSFWLENAGHTVLPAGSVLQAQELVRGGALDVLLSDIRLAQQETGIDLLAWTRQFDPCIAVVLVTGFPEVTTAVDALRLEAYDLSLIHI